VRRLLALVLTLMVCPACGHRGTCEPVNGEPAVPGYVGLARVDAERKAAEDGLTLRVMCIDGVGQSGTADHRSDRVNVGLRHDRVVTAQRY
jgi:hypothetical protein